MGYKVYFFPPLSVLVDFIILEQRCSLEGSDFKILRESGGKKGKKEDFLPVHERPPENLGSYT